MRMYLIILSKLLQYANADEQYVMYFVIECWIIVLYDGYKKKILSKRDKRIHQSCVIMNRYTIININYKY